MSFIWFVSVAVTILCQAKKGGTTISRPPPKKDDGWVWKTPLGKPRTGHPFK